MPKARFESIWNDMSEPARWSALVLAAVSACAWWSLPSAWADGQAPAATSQPAQALIDPAAAGASDPFTTTSAQVSLAASADPAQPGVVVSLVPGSENYPGVKLKPQNGGVWDLSACGHIEARVVNTGDQPLSISLRVDNAGDWRDNPWNTESATVAPGQSSSIKVIFGYAHGHKPGFRLNPQAVTQVMLFSGKIKAPASFRVEALQAGGPPGELPPVEPAAVRLVPPGGVMLGPSVTIDPGKQLQLRSGAAASLAGSSLHVTLPSSGAAVELAPALGRWDLRQATEVIVTLRNTGKSSIQPRVTLSSNGGPTGSVAAEALAPGTSAWITVPFAAAIPWVGPDGPEKNQWHGRKGTGTKFSSDAVKAVSFSADGAADFEVTAITAVVIAAELPAWLGQRPPVEGDWEKTFEEEFTGSEIDASKWRIYGENHWDKKSHFSKNNVLLGDGLVRLRFLKQHGHQNDDPNHARVNDYATGYLDTYGKWTQRYGYFEARMKLPTSPGLWPAFWMMPERGTQEGPQWKRADTGRGGMEFDIMEHLTRWGPCRYNIAMHWDGYGKEHKATGAAIYIRPDKDGFITSGLLWMPGKLEYYCNGLLVASWRHERISNVPANLLFTLPMGGWDNSPLDDARLPDDFVIDYVRCWQRRDLPAASAPAPAAEVDRPELP